MIPMLYTAEDVVFPAPTTDFGRRVLAAAVKHELMLPVIGGEGAHILGRVTLGELTAFAAEFVGDVLPDELFEAIDDVTDWLDHSDYTESDVRPSIQRLNDVRLRRLRAKRATPGVTPCHTCEGLNMSNIPGWSCADCGRTAGVGACGAIPTDAQIKALAEQHLSYVFTYECEEVVAFARAVLALGANPSEEMSFDVEAMLRECIPPGSFFGSLKVADAIRAYFAARGVRVLQEGRDG